MGVKIKLDQRKLKSALKKIEDQVRKEVKIMERNINRDIKKGL
ncbi:hypothetical protein [Alkalihalophilus marmarensis]|uniref:Uncharacterized protein n=1 Tax=Alkalihalophilus marmarensis DSM 21297 TaxID=1188261 RepID=U6SRW5_9BACI|nr:hypothetical protein [Alkalihalophilus marmarensis]ERN54333.1 hypothetical protein A33I_07905 [Alkalihalophilus marmarensis DSM 21297]